MLGLYFIDRRMGDIIINLAETIALKLLKERTEISPRERIEKFRNYQSSEVVYKVLKSWKKCVIQKSRGLCVQIGGQSFLFCTILSISECSASK